LFLGKKKQNSMAFRNKPNRSLEMVMVMGEMGQVIQLGIPGFTLANWEKK
jgi:hypothetical protein